jgi:hypothetical protein
LVSFFSLLTPVPRRHAKLLRESPRDTLLRRFASGEIDEQDYERRKALVERDAPQKDGYGTEVAFKGPGKPLSN